MGRAMPCESPEKSALPMSGELPCCATGTCKSSTAKPTGEPKCSGGHLFLSYRTDGGDLDEYVQDVTEEVRALGTPCTIMTPKQTEPPSEEELAKVTLFVAFLAGGPPYGEKADRTFQEVKRAREAKVALVAVQLTDEFPPPTGEEEGTAQNGEAFSGESATIIDARPLSAGDVAEKLHELAGRQGSRDTSTELPANWAEMGKEQRFEAVRALPAWLPQVKELDLPRRPPRHQMEELGEAVPLMVGLEKFALVEPEMRVEGGLVRELCKLPKLRVLSLTSCGVDNQGVLALAAQLPSSLESLSLRGNELGELGGSALAAPLRKCGELAQLNLPHCGLEALAGQQLALALPALPKLKRLNLRDNAIEDEAGKAVAVNLGGARELEALLLGCCELARDSAWALAKALPSWPKLKMLDLGFNDLGDEAGATLVMQFSNTKHLEDIWLNACHLGEDTCKELCEVLPTLKSLKECRLTRNDFNAEERRSLRDLLKRLNLPPESI